jgi:hypothetical protein
MSIATLSDAVLRRLVPTVKAGACLAPEPCGPCGNFTGPYCYGGRMALLSYYNKKTDCYGRCTTTARTLCAVRYTGGPC